MYYVESETSDDQYYSCKFKPDVLEPLEYCSCKDNSNRHLKCKYIFAIEFAIKLGTIKDIDRIPNPTVEDVKLDIVITKQPKLGHHNLSYDKLGQTNLQSSKLGQTNNKTLHKPISKSYLEDDYDF